MRHPLLIVTMAFSITISAGASISVWGKGTVDLCEKSIPKSLQEQLRRTYPDYRVVTLSMLTDVGQRIYSQDNKSRCPGVARVRFFDKNKVDYAIAITKGSEPQESSNVLLAKKGQGTFWELTMLDTDVQGVPAVLTLPPNKYTGYVDESSSRTLSSHNEAIFVVYYESSSLVYALTERGIEKVWMSD